MRERAVYPSKPPNHAVERGQVDTEAAVRTRHEQGKQATVADQRPLRAGMPTQAVACDRRCVKRLGEPLRGAVDVQAEEGRALTPLVEYEAHDQSNPGAAILGRGQVAAERLKSTEQRRFPIVRGKTAAGSRLTSEWSKPRARIGGKSGSDIPPSPTVLPDL